MTKKTISILWLWIAVIYSGSTFAQTAVGGINPDGSAMLDVQSTAKGVLFPRISDPAIITNPATGLMIFNTGSRCLQINLGTPAAPAWQNIKCTTCGAYVAVDVWKEFMCHNLGADTNADPFTPSWKLIGNYYQWGIKDVAAAGPSDENTPNADALFPWNTTPAIDGAWQDGTKTTNDPCPVGFRIPTKDQWDGVKNNPAQNPQSNADGSTWTDNSNNYTSGKFFGPALFLPAAGGRGFNTGALFDRGYYGYYWSSTVSGSVNAWDLNFDSGGAYMDNFNRTHGFSLRCVAQ
jgi:uncharacterized protein (TIGR02145 family)